MLFVKSYFYIFFSIIVFFIFGFAINANETIANDVSIEAELGLCNCSNPLNYIIDDLYYFLETITISGSPGDSWALVLPLSSGMFNDLGEPIMEVVNAEETEVGSGIFVLTFWHQYNVGYVATFTNTITNVILDNICQFDCAPSQYFNTGGVDPVISGFNVGDVYYNEVSGMVFTWAGEEWLLSENPLYIGTNAPNFPGASSSDFYWDSTNNILYIWASSSWTIIGAFPENLILNGEGMPSNNGNAFEDIYIDLLTNESYIWDGAVWEAYFGCASINILQEINCDNGNEGTYDVTIQINGGAAPYFLQGDYSGELYPFESATFSITDGESYGFVVYDELGCEVVIEQEVEPCSKQECDEFFVDYERNCEPAGITGNYVVNLAIGAGTPPYIFTGSYAGTLPTQTGSVSFSVADGEGFLVEVIDAIGCEIIIDELAIEACIVEEYVPVELLSFEVNSKEGFNELNWQTATEQDNYQFIIEYSLDGAPFELLTKILGRGNSSVKQTYHFTHDIVKSGTYYYRLFQEDFDGQTELIATKQVNQKGDFGFEIAVNGSDLILELTQELSSFNIDLYNYNGQQLASFSLNGDKQFFHSLNIDNYPPGFYIVSVWANEKRLTKKFLIGE